MTLPPESFKNVQPAANQIIDVTPNTTVAQMSPPALPRNVVPVRTPPTAPLSGNQVPQEIPFRDAAGNIVLGTPLMPMAGTAAIAQIGKTCGNCGKTHTQKVTMPLQSHAAVTRNDGTVDISAIYGGQLPGVHGEAPAVDYTAATLAEPPVIKLDDTVQILWHTVGFGRIGFGGVTGYGGTLVPPKSLSGWNFISAHAPSAILIRNTKPIRLAGFFNTGSSPKNPVTFYATGNYIGQVAGPGSSTDDQYGSFVLWPDEHLLEIILNGSSNNSAHTIWAYKVEE